MAHVRYITSKKMPQETPKNGPQTLPQKLWCQRGPWTWSIQEWSCTNSCYVIYAILLPSNIKSIKVALTFLCFQASLVSCHKYWQKRAGNRNVQPPLYELWPWIFQTMIWTSAKRNCQPFSKLKRSSCRARKGEASLKIIVKFVDWVTLNSQKTSIFQIT